MRMAKAKNGIFGIIIFLHYLLFVSLVVWHTKCLLPNWRGVILVGLSRLMEIKKRENFFPDLGTIHTTAKQLIRPEQVKRAKMRNTFAKFVNKSDK